MTSFDPATHTYEINGRRVPNVTQVLGDLIPGWHAADWYLERGRAVHAAAAFIAQGIEFDADPQIEGEVRALRRFFAEVKPKVVSVERPVYSERYQFAGCLDLLCHLDAPELVVIDYKATLTPSLPYQCAFYALAIDEMPMKCAPVTLGMGVEIRGDGTYGLSDAYDLKRYKQGALSLLTAYGIRRRCNIKTQEGEQ